MTTILVFIFVFGLIIFVHELGHFVTAKKAGVRVDEFGFGFPPRIFSKKVGETIYSINLFPIGGFVKIFGEDGEGRKDSRSFSSKPIWQRSIIIVSGVLMNFLLAAILLSVGFMIGLPEEISDDAINVKEPKVQLLQVAPGSPADEAGMMMGDTIFQLSFEDEVVTVNKVGEVQDYIDQHRGQAIVMTMHRGDEVIEATIVPRINPPEGEGATGVALARTARVSYPWYESIYKGFVSVVMMTILIVSVFAGLIWKLLTSGYLVPEVGGPIKIYALTGQAAKLGFIYVLQFAAIININIAIINAFPIPALDGGRLLFLLIEKIKGSPINQKVENYAHMIGFALLILLIVAITWRDIFA